ncbi:SPOR domain-containing protein [Sphingomonas sp.]|uniref:tetratricopeptide repeat protein n=1 Tax=Sphingomonas sp. TaxID=28214 RepID=UPI00286D70E6|nr:SPOR domain-containing protein [Sphingomonas sp.]
MARSSTGFTKCVMLALAAASAVVAAPAPAAAQATYATPRESPADALARNLRVLATDSRNFQALIGAGRAALAMGDTQAAAGFFGRAEEVWPTSPLPQAGMGASMVSEGDAAGALVYFQRALAKGGSVLAFAADRGLAFDLLGRHAEAQADYRAALPGADGDEARRRLALSLAISGDQAGALTALDPLIARRDAGGVRCRALVLALSGDAEGARRAMESALPGSSSRMDPFFKRLPTLRSDQKAAAVHLGIFPDWSGASLAAASPALPPAAPADRLRSIDDLLAAAPATPPPVIAAPPPAATQMANLTPRPATSPARVATPARKHWVQLASGANPAALPNQFRTIRSRKPALFEGIAGYIAEDSDRARLLIGPFGSSSDAQEFAEVLEDARIDAFSWTSKPGETIRKLPRE